MRTRIAGMAVLLAGAVACGGSPEGDDPDLPGVDASGTADTELFTKDPDTIGIPTVEQGGTPVDSIPPGTPGTPVQSESDIGKTP